MEVDKQIISKNEEWKKKKKQSTKWNKCFEEI